MEHSPFGNLFVAVIVVVLVLGGPFTLFVAIKILNSVFGGLKAKVVRLAAKDGSPELGIAVQWDGESFEHAVTRVRMEGVELVRGGRSLAVSYTFEDKSAKKKSFVIPLKLSAEDWAVLTDAGLPSQARSVARSSFAIEVETLKNETFRFKVSKKSVRKVLSEGLPVATGPELELLSVREPDSWSVLTRVFPWKKVVAQAAAEPQDKKAHAAKPAAAAAAATTQVFDFVVTKVWIEPGCIVCDACENEAPDVFQVLPDTCIVRENAPLTGTGSIVAAAEGCPVNVIKYDKAPKPA